MSRVTAGTGVFLIVNDNWADGGNREFKIDSRSWDFRANGEFPDDPTEGEQTNHANRILGIIGAQKNGDGIIGLASGASLIAVSNFTEGLASVFPRLELYSSGGQRTGEVTVPNPHYFDKAAIINNSWGNNFPFNLTYPIAQGSATSFNYRKNSGAISEVFGQYDHLWSAMREGLGLAFVVAAGNDREDGADAGVIAPGMLRQAIVVGSVKQRDKEAGGHGLSDLVIDDLSNAGANVLVVAPGRDVLTTGVPYFSQTEDFQKATGTSFAAPIVSAVIALMLEAEPDLGWRDIRTILALSARKIVPPGESLDNVYDENKANFYNGGGLSSSRDYGFGLVDAGRAVRLAEYWLLQRDARATTLNATNKISAEAKIEAQTKFDKTVKLAPNTERQEFIQITFSISDADDLEVEQVVIWLDFDRFEGREALLSNLEVQLWSPSGTDSVILLDRPYEPLGEAGYKIPDHEFPLHTNFFLGEAAAGKWVLRIDHRGATMTLFSGGRLGFSSFGAAGHDKDDDVYVFTDEYGVVKTLDDSDEGLDTINASTGERRCDDFSD